MPRLEANLVQALFDLDMPIRRAVFLTYRLDPAYFAEAIYPELRRRGCDRTLILMDVAQYQSLSAPDELGKAGRVILERFSPGVLFHPKVFVVAGAGRYRCVVGSANLTREGFEHNRELFSLLTEETGDTENLLRLLELVEARLRQASAAARVLRETVAELRAALVGRSVPRLAPLVWNGLGGPPLWRQLRDGLGAEPLHRAVVLSPYFESPDHFDNGILKEWLASGATVDLYVPFDQARSRVPRQAIAQLAQQYPDRLQVFGLRTGGRVLHGKLIALVSKSHAWLLSGSANLTAAALKGQNVEVGLLFKMPWPHAQAYLERLLLSDARPLDPEDLPHPEPDVPSPPGKLTGFLLSAVLSIKDDHLTLTLDRPVRDLCPTPSDLVLLIGGQRISLEWVTQTDQIVALKSASQYLRAADGTWQLGTVTVCTADGSAQDWRLIELSLDEALDESGVELDRPEDLETFVAALLNPRLMTLGRAGGRTRSRYASINRSGYNFEDVEAALDWAYRLASSLEAHFARLMTDPYTLHRWRGDWLRFTELFAQADNMLGPVGRALISTRLLAHLEACLAQDPKYARKEVSRDGLLVPSLRDLYRMALTSPGFSAPTLAACLSLESR